MKVVAYFRRNADTAKAEAELAVQHREVTRWIENEDGNLVAEFTEEETGGKARPAFGLARKAAQAEGAVLLVATSKAIGPSERFAPYSSADPRIVSLPDPEEADRKVWSRSRSIVVYLRTSAPSCDAEAEDADLVLQRDAVASLILPDFHTVVGTFIEVEPLASADKRPALDAALASCRERRAQLIIGTTDAIEGSVPFEPAFEDVPYDIATRAADRWADVIPAPAGQAPAPVALHFGAHQVRNRRPIYLVNRTGAHLQDVAVTRSGWTLALGDLTQMQPETRMIESLADVTAALVGSFELAFDSDFMISWSVTGKDADGHRWSGTATLDKGGPPSKPLPIVDWRPLDPSTPPGSD